MTQPPTCPLCGYALTTPSTDCPNCGESLAEIETLPAPGVPGNPQSETDSKPRVDADKPVKESAEAVFLASAEPDEVEKLPETVPGEDAIQALINLARGLQAKNNFDGALEAYRQAQSQAKGALAKTLETVIMKVEEERRASRRKWFHAAIFVVLFGIGLTTGSGLITLGKQGVGPLANLATATPTVTSTPTHTPTPTITPTPTPHIGSTSVSPADGMLLVYVPEGQYTMGSDSGDTDERPEHAVYLDSFWIDQTEVTNAMYARCVQAGACTPPLNPSSRTRGSYFGNPEYDRYPVIYISWYDARVYCAWAGRRLPTEAEWEKAARGVGGHLYPWGDDIPNTNLLNFFYFIGDTVEVGSYPAGVSPFGALDMAGNVGEWVADWYAGNFYATSPEMRPSGPSSGKLRVWRGGAWDSNEFGVRAINRGSSYPFTSNNLIGFRCASRTAPP